MKRRSRKKRVKTFSLGIANATVYTSWADAKLTIEDFSHSSTKRVHLHIRNPADIFYLREHLKKIEDYWRSDIKTLDP